MKYFYKNLLSLLWFKKYKLGKKKYSSFLLFAPPAGGGVQRWLKFVKYLPDFGWEPTVFIPENLSYPIVDETLQKMFL